LSVTGAEDVFAVGYSMGTAQYLIALAEKPEYNDKVRGAFLLGPAALMGRSITPFTPVIDVSDEFFTLLRSVGEVDDD